MKKLLLFLFLLISGYVYSQGDPPTKVFVKPLGYNSPDFLGNVRISDSLGVYKWFQSQRTIGGFTYRIINGTLGSAQIAGNILSWGTKSVTSGVSLSTGDTITGGEATVGAEKFSFRAHISDRNVGLRYKRTDNNVNYFLLYDDSLTNTMKGLQAFSTYSNGNARFFNNVTVDDTLAVAKTIKTNTISPYSGTTTTFTQNISVVDTAFINTDTITGAIDLTDIGTTDLSNSTTPLNTIYCKELSLEEGANAAMGTAALVNGTIVVNTTKVTANSRIFLTLQDCDNCGYLWISARTAATSFTVSSSNVLDDSTVAWMIVEPN